MHVYFKDILLITILISLSYSVRCQIIGSYLCKKITVNGVSCGCMMEKDGNNVGAVSLYSLAEQNAKKPRFSATYSNGAIDLSYSPCYNFTQPGDCKDVAACQMLKKPKTQYVPIGLQSSITYQVNAKNNVQFVYTDTYEKKLRTFTVTVICDKKATTPVFKALANTGATYFATLKTICGCPNGCPSGVGGLSGGSVLLIIFFVLLFVYFVGGIIFMKYVRNAEGTEVIPNVGFWSSLPSFIRDGFTFTFSRCRGGSSGDSSYEKI